ncbi:Pyruvate kinase [Seminavis robusta]|uniref:Pyruvate kinase n=1 Tax=Seminavis robusta TaxID=568900 RepID=A0A9N8D8V5_9STRA|nr:Pyruvate kinase [Seminavis robusta]|eukprot:Sro44_g026460.1 Pyruvate kinase (539) ;mRNA; f:12196-14000
MISNTASVPTLRGGYITLETVTKPCLVKERKTKIICTLGPACWSEEGLAKLMDAGMNAARFNFSHGDHAGHLSVLERLRKVCKEKKRNIAVLMDTKGPEIRTGFFANDAKKIELTKGETLVLTGDYSFKGDNKKLACSYPTIAQSVKEGQQILCADGSLVLTVLSCNEAAKEVSCRIENNCSIGERKNMNLPGVVVDLPTFTEKDVDDIVNWACKYKVDFIAASFIRKGSDVTKLRKLLADNGGSEIKIICKIENQEGLENYQEILKETDAIMVARGDLGMEIPASKVFLAQKYMIREANLMGRPVVTATQMLESMITNPRPTRAECSDVANAVYDGTDVVMLSGETANGPYFEEAVKVMNKTCCEAESSRNYNLLYQSVRNSIIRQTGTLSVGESMSSSAVKTALDIHSKLIVVLSESGRMANYISKFRPSVSVLMMTPQETAARQASGLMAGLHSVAVHGLDKSEELLEELSHELLENGIAMEGDEIVVCGGRMAGLKEQVRVYKLAKGKKHGHIINSHTFFFDAKMIFTFVPESF